MSEIFGNYLDKRDYTQEYLIVSFSSETLAIQDRWKNNSLSADFLASYWGTFIPAYDKSSQYQRIEISDAVSFIANELLENALKFSHEETCFPIRIALYLSESALYFYVTNSVSPENSVSFKKIIREILSGDKTELYIRKLESNAEGNTEESRIGYLTILNNYDTEIAWKFEPADTDPAILTVTTMVRLEVIRARNP